MDFKRFIWNSKKVKYHFNRFYMDYMLRSYWINFKEIY